jgi:hypothetical protein
MADTPVDSSGRDPGDGSSSGSTPFRLGDTATWPTKVLDTIDDLVALVRDRCVRPILLAARAVVYGILVATAAVVLIALLSIALVRIVTVYLPNHRVWAADALVGGIFVLLGIALWSRRRALVREEDPS